MAQEDEAEVGKLPSAEVGATFTFPDGGRAVITNIVVEYDDERVTPEDKYGYDEDPAVYFELDHLNGEGPERVSYSEFQTARRKHGLHRTNNEQDARDWRQMNLPTA